MARHSSLETVVGHAAFRYCTSTRFNKSPFRTRVNEVNVEINHRNTFDDLYAIWQCFRRAQYEVPVLPFSMDAHRRASETFHRRIVASGRQPLIVDCGANIGAGSAWFMARFPSAHIVAVEPSTRNVEMLRKNLSSMDVDIVEGAVAKTPGTIPLSDPYGSTLAFRTLRDDKPQPDTPTVSVEAYTLDSIVRRSCKSTTPFIMKIDIEGAEEDLFSPEEDLSAIKEFPIIIIEPHDFMLPGRGASSNFLRFHADLGRDFLFSEENIFSIDLPALEGRQSLVAS